MLKLNLEYLHDWFRNPITQVVMKALIEKQQQENLTYLSNTSINSEQYTIERNLYRLMGKNEVIKKLTDKDHVKTTLLRDYVQWSDDERV